MPEDRTTITVNGRPLEAALGEPLLAALRRAGHDIPTLCHDERLTPYGGCRLCVVARRDGRGGLIPACSTPVLPGMVIETDAEEVVDARRRQLQLLLLNHRMECPVCERNTDCRFQDLVYRYGTPDERLPFERRRIPVDERSPLIVRDPEKCVLCGKCVRLCDEVQGVAEIGIAKRGLEARVTTLLGRPLDCEFCGQCVDACPVGALVSRPFAATVPAWMRSAVTTTCSYCSCGCQVTVESHSDRLQRVTSPADAAPNRGKLCAKGRYGWDVLEAPDRLTEPLVRRDGRLVPAGWDEALDMVTERLQAAQRAGSAIVGVGTSRMTCEDAYAFQRMLRTTLASPHVGPGVSGGVRALLEGARAVLGEPRSTATLGDLAEAHTVLVLRADPTRTHPLVKTEIVQGVRQRGQKLILAHALSGGLERHATVFLPLHPGGEEPLLLGLIQVVLEEGLADIRSISSRPGFEAWRNAVAAYTPAVVEALSGVAPARLREVARLLAASPAVVGVVPTATGIPGSGGSVTAALAQLLLLLGHADGPGRGVLVLGEKANLQGVLDAGLHPALLPGRRTVDDPASRAEVEAAWSHALPAGPGWEVLEAMQRSAAGEVGALYLVGQDPLGAWPRSAEARAGVHGAGFVVVQDAFLTDTARAADVVLPVAILLERTGSITGADGERRPLNAAVPRPALVAQDGEIFAELARRLGAPLPAAAALSAEMERLAPRPRDTRAVTPLAPPPPPRPVAEWAGTRLDTSPQLFHSGAVTGHSRRLMELAPGVALRLAQEDVGRLGTANGGLVRMAGRYGEVILRVRVDHTVRPGTAVALWQNCGDDCTTLLAADDDIQAVEIRRSV